jgi:hypothetical protein
MFHLRRLGDPGFAPGEILRVTFITEGRPGPGIPAEAVVCASDLWPSAAGHR